MLDQSNAKPHRAGHRERLRGRTRSAGLPALPDYELLELFLFRSQPQGDVKPIAKALLHRFGSLAAVLAGSVEDLMTVRAEDTRGRTKGIGAETALDLAAMHEVARRIAREEASKRPVISSWSALLPMCAWRCSMSRGSSSKSCIWTNAPVDPRRNTEPGHGGSRACLSARRVQPRAGVSARPIIIVHNHPSGDPTPSRADIQMTKQVVEAARALALDVHDHLMVGRDGVASFKQLGLM